MIAVAWSLPHSFCAGASTPISRTGSRIPFQRHPDRVSSATVSTRPVSGGGGVIGVMANARSGPSPDGGVSSPNRKRAAWRGRSGGARW